MKPERAILILGLLSALSLALGAAGCSDDDPPPCYNGECVCRPDEACELPCWAPPCKVACIRDNPSCVGQCGNGECYCGPRSHCQLGCHSPPCHQTCDQGSQCGGTCANGTCRCGLQSSCTFTCAAGPCHVECQGDNGACDGECANGTCSCGPESSCAFTCLDGNCSATCAAGSICVLECPNGRAGEQGCRFDTCAAGAAEVCPGGRATACGAPCPPST